MMESGTQALAGVFPLHFARRLALPISFFGVFFLAGCAVTPNAVVRYKPTEWIMGLSATYTLSCKNTDFWFTSSAFVVPSYFAGKNHEKDFVIRFRDFNSPVSDADMSVSLTEDGRLKSLNSSSTGQGEALVATAVKAFGAVAAAGAVPPQQLKPFVVSSGTQNSSKPSEICDVVKRFGRSDVSADFHQLSIILTGYSNSEVLKGNLQPTPGHKKIVDELDKFINLKTSFEATIGKINLQPISYEDELRVGGYVEINVHQVRALDVRIRSESRGDSRILDAGLSFDEQVSVPIKVTGPDTLLKLRVPQPPFFGKQSFSVDFAESGRVTRIGYGQTTGAVGSLGATTTAVSADSAIENAKTNALRAAADQIAQQERLARCVMNPVGCV